MRTRKLRNRSISLSGGWFVIMAAILWGTTGTAQAFVPTGTQPLAVGTIRLLLGAFALSILAAHRGELGELRSWRSWSPGITLFAAAGVALYQIFFFAGVARTGVAVGTIVGIGTTPIAAGIFVYLWQRKQPGRRWIIATTLAIFGCALLVLTGGNIEIDPLGILLAVAAGASYALYTMLSKELLGRHQPGAVLTVTFTIGSILLLPILLTADFAWLREPHGLAVALHLGIITVGVAYLLFAIGLSAVPVATAATLTLAEPLTAAVLGLVVLGEKLNWLAFIGILLIFCGLLVLTVKTPAVGVQKPASISDSKPEQGHSSTVP